MRRIRNLRRRVETLEDEIGIEPPEYDNSSAGSGSDTATVRAVVEFVEDESSDNAGASVKVVLDVAEALGMKRSHAEHGLEKLRRQGEVYEPQSDYLRMT